MKASQKDEDLFHLFVQYTDKLPPEAAYFPYFDFMDQSIRKIFNQLKKKTAKKEKNLEVFDEFWQQLTNQDRIKVYCNWVLQLRKSLQLQQNLSHKIEQESMSIQDQIYIKKTSIFQKWEKKLAKLTPTHLHLTAGNKSREYELKDYEIRKSRGKDHFAWVLQAINNAGKTLHCKAESETMYNQWYYALSVNISNQRIYYFLNVIKKEKLAPGYINSIEMKKTSSKKLGGQKIEPQKTLTELMIDKQMKTIDNENFNQIDEDKSDQFESIGDENQNFNDELQEDKTTAKKNEEKAKNSPESNPNVFKRLAPEYKSLENFADTPFNSALIVNDSECRIYELPQKGEGQEIILKMFTVFPFPKSLIFNAITSETMGWNDEVDVFTVKTKISSENTVLIYEKNKSYGLLYRERDFLYLRHCFSVVNLKQKNTFMIDKSIDSIHHPPFMSLVRAEKKLIWSLIEKQNQKECLLIVEGWIKGGGYMNQIQNKEITLKHMKKIVSMKGFLKQLSFSQANSNVLLKQQWAVDFNNDEGSSQNQTEESEQSEQKAQGTQAKFSKQKSIQIIKKEAKDEKQESELAEFIKRTQQESSKLEEGKQQKGEIMKSQERMDNEQYVPPAFDEKKMVIIPQKYLKKVHLLSPIEKPIKPDLYPHVRGHHLWKGEWEVLSSGGLGYVDQQKMKQQKKVLTYIIKRIGKNIFSGKGILNISLPVDIFCIESNIERLAMSFGFFPYYLEKAALIKQPHEQLKYIIGGAVAGSLIYMTMQKPFNPILGETYQCWIDGCPVYFQQISHHPPIAAFMMKGRGYTVSGCVQAKMDLSINSGTGNNEGIFKVQFDNGNVFYYTTPAGCLTGLTYGQRKLNMVGRCFYWSDSGLFLEMTYNPAAKTKGFFGAAKGEGDQKLSDYFQGFIKQYSPETVKSIAFKQESNKITPIIPKNGPTGEPIKTHQKVTGRWNKYVKCGDELIFDVDTIRYYRVTDERYPLPSQCSYRQDIVYRRLKNFILSQQFKEVLEIKQREDRKLRARLGKNSSSH